MISKFNGTPTPKGSYRAKTGVNEADGTRVLESTQPERSGSLHEEQVNGEYVSQPSFTLWYAEERRRSWASGNTTWMPKRFVKWPGDESRSPGQGSKKNIY